MKNIDKLFISTVLSIFTISCSSNSSSNLFADASIYNMSIESKNINSQIDSTFKPLVESGKYTGIVVGIIKGNTQKIFKYGRVNKNSNIAPDEKTIYQIASLTKVFTTTLLADMAVKKTVSLNDPLQKFLPNTVKVPNFQGQNIELWQLATHTSGLPKMPEDLMQDINNGKADLSNPLQNYSLEKTYNYVSNFKLFQDNSAHKGYGYYEYSNLGMGLLGHALSLKLKTNYENAVKQIICKPLGMNNTTIALSKDQKEKYAMGYFNGEEKVNQYFSDGFIASGALASNMEDMMKFLSANLGITKSSLTPAINASHVILFPELIALGWQLDRSSSGKQIIWHNGALTSGYKSYLAFIKESQTGVVILSNSWNINDSSIDNEGKNIINLLN